MTAESGSELLMPLPQQMTSGVDAVVFEGPELARAPEAGLNFIEDQQGVVGLAPLG